MSKAFKWPKLPNSRPYLDKGYTSIQMREYALKCIGEAIRNKQWVGLSEEDFVCVNQLCETPIQGASYAQLLLKEKNCGQ